MATAIAGLHFDAEPSLDDLSTLEEADLLERIVLVYRHRFIHNPDPAKESWWDFVETVHETLDVDGRTSRDGLTFLVRDWTDEATADARLLNRVFLQASRVWNDSVHPECRVPKDLSTIASITDTAADTRAPTAVMDVSSITDTSAEYRPTTAVMDVSSITDTELVDILRVMSSSCPACRAFSNAMDPVHLQKGVETLLWQEHLEEAQDEREYECD